MDCVDLRSDTLTTPTPEMRDAMRDAEVGDDGRSDERGRGGDPTVNRLEDMAAEMLGKEAALFCSSGTMGNMTAISTYCVRGDKVAVEPDLHVVRTEKAPFMDRYLGLVPISYARDSTGRPDAASFAQACSEGVALACVENTHNYGGGICVNLERQQELYSAAQKTGVPVHMDGARIFNAARSLGVSVKKLADCADSVMFCLSKGLGAPFGSMLCGKRDFIIKARETKKLLGGGMRQAGVMAAAGIVALQTGVERLDQDHEKARKLGAALAQYSKCTLIPVESNIVMLDVSATGKSSVWFVKNLASYGLLGHAMGDKHLRLTTYRGVTTGDIDRAIAIFDKFIKTSFMV